MRINATFPGAATAIAGIVLALGAAAAPAADAPAAAAPSKAQAPAIQLTPAQHLAAGRLRGAWSMSAGVAKNVWDDFDPNSIPVLFVEGRAGRAPFALLMRAGDPPDGFATALPASESGPAIHLSTSYRLPEGARSPMSLGGRPTAVHIDGRAWPDTPEGSESAERVIPAIVHEMVHVLQAKTLAPDVVPAGAPAYKPRPEAIALASVEGRLLAEALYADPAKTALIEDLARKFVAVRRVRWRLAAGDADDERRRELWEGPAAFAETQVLKWGGQKFIDPPPDDGTDPGYHRFQYGILWRITFLIDRLLHVPLDGAAVAARIPATAGAQITLLDRLGRDWRPAILKPETSIVDLIADRVPMDPAQQEEALASARTGYGYEAALALARERAGR